MWFLVEYGIRAVALTPKGRNFCILPECTAPGVTGLYPGLFLLDLLWPNWWQKTICDPPPSNEPYFANSEIEILIHHDRDEKWTLKWRIVFISQK